MKRTKTSKSPPVSDTAVQARTGKVWSEWFAILEKWGAAKKLHKETATYLYEKHKLPGWWAQMVTVGYERARGLRQVHQTAEGYNASRSKVFHVPLSKLYAAWKDAAARKRWMKGDAFAVTKARANKAIRGTWDTGKSRVEVMFYAKGSGKSLVTIDHRKLRSAKEVHKMKAYWGRQLETLMALLNR
jgi:hypothetical protein